MPVQVEIDKQLALVLYIIAIIINVLGNLIDSIGWCIQKQSHISRLSNIKNKNQSFVKDKAWCKGFVVHTIGNKFAKLAYVFGPASLLLPLDALKIVWTTVFAHKYLNETAETKEVIGIAVIIIGVILSTIFGPKPSEYHYTIIDMVHAYEQLSFLIVAGIITLFTLIDYVWIQITLCTQNDYGYRVFMLSYIWFAAYLSSWNTLFVKQIFELIISSFISKDIAILNWTHWLTYVTIIALIFTSVNLEYWRQKALKMYHASYVAAIYIVLRIAFGIMLTSIFFQEFRRMEIYRLVLFIVGIVLSFIGVVVVVYDKEYHQQMKQQKTKYEVNVNAEESESDDSILKNTNKIDTNS